MKKTLLAFLFAMSSLLMANDFLSWPNPTMGTPRITNIVAVEKFQLQNGGPQLYAVGAGDIMMLNADGVTALDNLIWGTNTASGGVGIRQNGNSLYIRNGDNSDWGTLRVGPIRFNGTVQPATNNAIDLGTSALRMKDIYADGDYIVGASSSIKSSTARIDFASGSDTIAFRNVTAGMLTRLFFGNGTATNPAISFTYVAPNYEILFSDGSGAPYAINSGTVRAYTGTFTNALTLNGVAVETLDTAHPTTTALTYSGTNVTLTASSRQTYSRTLTLTNNCLLTITTTDGADGTITLKPDSSTSYTVYLDSGIRMQGVAASGSFVVTNSATETVVIAWQAALRGASAFTAATKGYFP